MAVTKYTQGQKVVVVVDSKDNTHHSSISEIENQVGKQNVIVTSGQDKVEANTVDAVVVYGAHSDDVLSNIIEYMKPGASVNIHVGNADDAKSLLNRLLLNGYVDYVALSSSEVVAKKPEWEVGASQSLNITPKNNTSSASPAAIWTSAEGNDDDIIDEDSLLSESDRNSKPKVTRDDCEVGPKKKACKNCTCGRAEEEVKEEASSRPKLTLDMLENPGVGSNCGSCSLGDAYRCGGCPYRGLPAFKVGERITLPDSFLADDI